MVSRKTPEIQLEWHDDFAVLSVEMALPDLDSWVFIGSHAYLLRGYAKERHLLMIEKDAKLFGISPEDFATGKRFLAFRWGRQICYIKDPSLAARVCQEACACPEEDLPPGLPRFPEHRLMEYDHYPYQRPVMTSPPAATEVAQQLLGLRLPAAIAMVDYANRKERFVFTRMNLLRDYDGEILLVFSGYRLHSTGLLTEPVRDIRANSGCRQFVRRTLANDWVPLELNAEALAL